MDIKQRVMQELNKQGLTDWVYRRNDRLTSTAGKCKYGYRIIELAGWFIDNNTDEEIELTILHELAHALTRGHGHDIVWSNKCKELGGNGLRYYNQGGRNVVNPNKHRYSRKRYTLKCECCGYTGGVYFRRMNNYTHKCCGGRLINIEI